MDRSPLCQRISGSGQLMWGAGPITVPGVSATDPSGTGTQTFDMAADGAGGAIIVGSWRPPTVSATSALAQRIKSDGSVAWSQSGAPVSHSANDSVNVAVLSDGAAGIFVAWQDCPSGSAGCDIAMQYLNGNGQKTWGRVKSLLCKCRTNNSRRHCNQTGREAHSLCGQTAEHIPMRMLVMTVPMYMRRMWMGPAIRYGSGTVIPC